MLSQLAAASRVVQMLENALSSLKTISDTWLSPSYTPWLVDVILPILCGVGLFLLILPWLDRKPASPKPRQDGVVWKVSQNPILSSSTLASAFPNEKSQEIWNNFYLGIGIVGHR